MAKRGGLPKISGPRSWREAIREDLLDAEPTAAEPDRLNGYVCNACGGVVVTRDVHEGVTPAFMACRVKGEPGAPGNDCVGFSQSCLYRLELYAMHMEARAAAAAGRAFSEEFVGELVAQGWPRPEWEWYMPTLREILRLERGEPSVAGHCRKGGLLIRRAGA